MVTCALGFSWASVPGGRVTSTNSEFGDSGESLELERGLGFPPLCREGQCCAGPLVKGQGQRWLSTQAPAPRLAPLITSPGL